MRKVAMVIVVSGALLVSAAPASSFTVEQPKTGECRQILVPGPATFPGNWETVSGTPAEFPGPWNGHGNANGNSALGPVLCP